MATEAAMEELISCPGSSAMPCGETHHSDRALLDLFRQFNQVNNEGKYVPICFPKLFPYVFPLKRFPQKVVPEFF